MDCVLAQDIYIDYFVGVCTPDSIFMGIDESTGMCEESDKGKIE